jgi:hypothetical protein
MKLAVDQIRVPRMGFVADRGLVIGPALGAHDPLHGAAGHIVTPDPTAGSTCCMPQGLHEFAGLGVFTL